MATYRRPESLSRATTVVCCALSDDLSISLVISIDGGGHERVVEIANELVAHEDKRVIAGNRNMGLRDHIISCGDLSLEYGSVIVLEDDLICLQFLHLRRLQARIIQKKMWLRCLSILTLLTN